MTSVKIDGVLANIGIRYL